MPLSVGELVAYIDAEDKGFGSTLTGAGQSLSRLQSTATTATASMEQSVDRAFSAIAQAITEGADPAAAIADLDRLVSAFDTLDSSLTEAGRQAGQGFETGLSSGLEGTRETGKQAGEQVAEGAESALGGNRLVGAGRDLIGGLFSGMKEGGSGGGIMSVASNLISSFKGAGWLAAGAAVGGVLIEGIKTAVEREELFATLAVRIGAFGDEAEKYGQIAGDVYAKGFGESLDQVTGAVTSVVQNLGGIGPASKQNVGQITQDAIVAAKALDSDVSEAVRAASQLVKTGLAKNWTDAFNQIIAVTQKGGNIADDLLDTVTEYSTQFREVGISGPKAFGLLQQASQAGARDLDTAADAIKEFALRSKDMSKSSTAAFRTLHLNAGEMFQIFSEGGPKADQAFKTVIDRLKAMKDPVMQNIVAVQLFGTKAEDLGDALYALDPTTATQKLGDFSNAAKNASNVLTSTAASDSEQWSRFWENALSTVGSGMLEQIKKFLPSPDMISEQWDEFSGFFTDTVGPFFADAWTAVKDKTVEIWTSVWGWLKSTAQAAGDWLGQVPGKIRDFFVNGWNDLQAKTVSAWESLKSGVSEKADALVEWVKQVPSRIGGFFSSGWSSLTSATSAAWENLKTAAVNKAGELITWMKGLPGKIKDGLGNLATLLLSAGGDLIQGLINGITAKAADAVNAAKGVVQNAVDGAKNLLGIHSPSKVAHSEIGEPISVGIAQGILSRQGDVGAAMSAVMTTARREASKGVASVTATLTQAKLGIGATATMGTIPLIPTIDATNHYTSSSSAISPYTNDTARYNYAGQIISGSIGSPSGGSSGGTTINVNMPNVTSLDTTTDIQQAASQFGFEYNIRATV